ncbi:uncharacterized protein LOC134035370 [Osmerus eperlanus]|uniref:uncharacterized protein LOC134035370 n=1 Tax=Osmerus eperlanus TaxID=29151 RepID=UPI002E0DC653
MQHIYMQSDEHLQVFTTVLSSQDFCKALYMAQMVVSHSYKPHWPDELELLQGDVIQVVSKREEARWFGGLQSGQQGYFPKSCVMELSQVGGCVHHHDSVHSSLDSGFRLFCFYFLFLTLKAFGPKQIHTPATLGMSRPEISWTQAAGPKRGQQGPLEGARGRWRGLGGSRGEGPLEGARGQRQGPILVLRPQNQTQLPQAPKPPAPSAPGLLQRILSKPRRRSENQGATNGAFEAD